MHTLQADAGAVVVGVMKGGGVVRIPGVFSDGSGRRTVSQGSLGLP